MAEDTEKETKETKETQLKSFSATETCPHCGAAFTATVLEGRMTAACPKCGRCVPLCDSVCREAGDCSDCKFCDLANYMNYLRGFVTVEQFLAALNPPLTDMTTGVPEGETPTLADYVNDTWGDEVSWDVKYWDVYRMVSECFLNAESSEEDCREFVYDVLQRNAQ